jgi:uncharacterized protein (DUF1697 family)
VPGRTTYAALLRGINLGSRNKIAMADLRALFERVGAEDVATYVQSGNVVFASAEPQAGLARTIERRIAADLGLEIAVQLRTRAQLAKAVRENPYAGHELAALHVTFLAERPERGRVRALDPSRSEPDEFHVAGREVYLYCPNGYGVSKLSNAWFEKQLDVAATTRNWRTVTAELTAT